MLHLPGRDLRAMEDLGCLWASQDQMSVEEVKHLLLCTTLELETVRMVAGEEMMKYRQNIMHLLGLLKVAYQERDQARGQLHQLLNKLAAPQDSSALNELLFHRLQPDGCLMPAKANSTLTESTNNSLSPVDSIFDSSSLVLENQRQNASVQEYVGLGSLVDQKFDPRMTMIDELAKGKALPQKGKLLEAIMEAGPLLHTLLMAGRLPQWRDPPPLQPISIPPMISIQELGPTSTGQMPFMGPIGIVAQKPSILGSHHGDGMYRANHQMCSASMLSLTGLSGLPRNSTHLLSSCSSINGSPVEKRGRFL
ncbi:hypothetical protein SAY86_002509 [Trapa natans]|uniref:Uncharacterized protein n=1 Tax=Trapa natans TaxID=22666 RepID=A0AAN7LHY6_TRANT|nr:hypothetical protein SAY86_002509 [Trapa natans]